MKLKLGDFQMGNELFAMAKELSKQLTTKVSGLDDIILFGSVARGDHNISSDIDLLLVMNKFDPNIYNVLLPYNVKIEKLRRYGISYGYGISAGTKNNMAEREFHILYCQPNDLSTGNLLIDNIIEDGISLAY
jgi:predicted nucleotidyltransferase